MGLTDALYGFAAAGLDKAGGTNFLGGALDAQRAKDLFTFQQSEGEKARQRVKKQDREEAVASRRGLLTALMAADVLRPADVAAAGGVDVLAGMDDSEFKIGVGTLQDARLKDLTLEEQAQIIRGGLRARGLPVPETMGNLEALSEAQARLQLYDLEAEQRRGQRKDVTHSLQQGQAQTRYDLGALLGDPLETSTNTLQQAFGRVAQFGAQVNGAAGDLAPEDYDNLMQGQNSMNDEISRAQVDVGLNALAAGSAGEILKGYAALEPALRRRARMRETISSTVKQAETVAANILGMTEAQAADLGLGSLRARIVAKGGAQEAMLDPALATELHGQIAAVASAETELRDVSNRRDAQTQADQLASGLASSPYFAVPEVAGFISRTGAFAKDEYLRAGFSAAVTKLNGGQMDSTAARDLVNSMAVAGAPAGMLREADAAAQRQLTLEVRNAVPDIAHDAYLSQAQEVGVAAFANVLARPVPEVKPAPRPETRAGHQFGILGFPPSEDRTGFNAYIADLQMGVEGASTPLVEHDLALSATIRDLNVKAVEAGRVDPDKAQALSNQIVFLNNEAEFSGARLAVRHRMATDLASVYPLLGEVNRGGSEAGADSSSSKVLEALGVGMEKATGEAGSLTDARIMELLQANALKETPNREAVTAEAAFMVDLLNTISKAMDADPEMLKRLRAQKVVRGADTDFPQLELLGYLLGH